MSLLYKTISGIIMITYILPNSWDNFGNPAKVIFNLFRISENIHRTKTYQARRIMRHFIKQYKTTRDAPQGRFPLGVSAGFLRLGMLRVNWSICQLKKYFETTSYLYNRDSLKCVRSRQCFYRDLVAAIVVNKFKNARIFYSYYELLYLSDNCCWDSFVSSSTSFNCFLLMK